MRIVVTGVSGQVGSALLPRLDGHEVIPVDFPEFDLGRPESLGALLDEHAPDFIINPAAYTAVDKAEDERDLAMRVNGEGPGVIARWAAARNVPLIHFSTDYVYDGSGDEPRSEEAPTRPLSVYGTSKLAGDVAVRAAWGSVLIVRTCWVYAANGANFLRTIARLARERTELRIVADQFGAPTTAAVIADAVVKTIHGAAAVRARASEANGLVHVAASGETSWHGFASAIVAGLAERGVKLSVEAIVPIRTEEYKVRATRPRNSRLNLSRLRNVFHAAPPSWVDALQPELDVLVNELKYSAELDSSP